MIKVSIITLGCKVNSYESDAMAGLLRSRGFEVVPEGEKADIFIVNTCSVTNIADRKSRQMISRCLKLDSDAPVIVTGCWSQREPDAAMALPGVRAVVGNNEKSRIADIVAEIVDGEGPVCCVGDIMKATSFDYMSAVSEGRTRAFLKIQDGCNRFCTYCAIPYARGRIRSRTPESVRLELEKLNDLGFVEVVLTGIHLTDYGKDLGGADLTDVLDCLEGLDNIKRLRFGSLEPHGMTDKLISRIASDCRVCRQFHLSLQSGSTSVLERMRRGYTADEYADVVDSIRSAYGREADRVAITTDIIAGFVGETYAEHMETMDFMRRIGFARVHVFPYSRRSGTAADKLPGQLTNNEKAERAKELIALGHELEYGFLKSFIGRDEKVLIESKQKDGLYFGFTDSYARVLSLYGEPNELKDVRIKSITEDKNGELSLLSDNCRRDTLEQGL
ncbi:MAG: tRNA (N(6)-L-threonylcarbamoyladenosine(37)-C(2))-methylthiotransferase MtaB [Clostridia bacterium]|nr:tRNA (N(6)-L-threonylcarbamoyladenosine(37)-C(2))-methylthiotransferase MtaB [Clostridia bacterium]